MEESIKAKDSDPNHLFKPGDLIVFSGLKIDATLVRLFTGSEYSHTTIILDTNLEENSNTKVQLLSPQVTPVYTIGTIPGRQCC